MCLVINIMDFIDFIEFSLVVAQLLYTTGVTLLKERGQNVSFNCTAGSYHSLEERCV